MKKKVVFSGDGGDPSQWIELFPYMTTAGNGVLDIPAIVSVAKKEGVKNLYIEQVMVDSPEVTLKKSLDYLYALDL